IMLDAEFDCYITHRPVSFVSKIRSLPRLKATHKRRLTMSNLSPSPTQHCSTQNQCPSVELLIQPRDKDLGGFSVRRVLPTARRKLVGPWIFFDHMGPARFPAGQGINVRPHPHINLATVTYLFEGEILHRDSLGSNLSIRPGDINLMVAGKG